MKSIIFKCAIFASGAAVGAAITWRIAQDFYEKKIDEELDRAHEYYTSGETTDEPQETTEEVEENDDHQEEWVDPTYVDYSKLIEEHKYKNHELEEGDEKMQPEYKPYVIAPDEFDTIDHETVSLTYFADGIVVDEMEGHVLSDDEINDLIGKDSLTHFGEYEDDSVFVRNDTFRIDYEILKDLRNFGEAYKDDPEDE